MSNIVTWVHNGDFRCSDQDGHCVVATNIINQFVKTGYQVSMIIFGSEDQKTTQRFVTSLGVSKVFFLPAPSYFNRVLRLLKLRCGINNKGTLCGHVFLGSNAVIDMSEFHTTGCWLVAGDVESRKFLQEPSLKSIPTIIASKLRESVYKKFKKVILYNEVESNSLPHLDNLITLPLGYNFTREIDEVRKQSREFDAIFSGDFKYHPNMKAAQDIINIFKDHPFTIAFVGYSASSIPMPTHSRCSFIVRSDVLSVQNELSKAKCYISPLSVGGGMKNKVLQAVDVGIPILGSDLLFEGFVIDKSPSFVVENYFYKYPSVLFDILGEYEAWESKAVETRNFFIDTYDWRVVFEKLKEQL